MKLLNRINTLIAGGGLALALVALTSTAMAADKKKVTAALSRTLRSKLVKQP